METNFLFKQIVETCWQRAGGTEEMESIETGESYQVFIPQAIEEVLQIEEVKKAYPNAVVPDAAGVLTIWKQMTNSGLAESKRTAGRNWIVILRDPNQFDWVLSERAPRYQWLKGPKAPKPPQMSDMPPGVIIEEQPKKARAQMEALLHRIDDFNKKKAERVREDAKETEELKVRLQELKEIYLEMFLELREGLLGINDILSIWGNLQKSEEKKAQLLSGEISPTITEEPELGFEGDEGNEEE